MSKGSLSSVRQYHLELELSPEEVAVLKLWMQNPRIEKEHYLEKQLRERIFTVLHNPVNRPEPL